METKNKKIEPVRNTAGRLVGVLTDDRQKLEIVNKGIKTLVMIEDGQLKIEHEAYKPDR